MPLTQIRTSNLDTTNSLFFRNRIINGAMVIDQRNAGASVTPANGAYTLDRWRYAASQASKFTVQQNAGSVTPPVGFSNYLGVTVASAVTIGSSDYFELQQRVEGFNSADLGFGTANAKTITVSFWVRSSLTGTFGGSLKNGSANRAYPFTYTINTANTWEYETITIAGDTTGTWIGATNGIGLLLVFGLGVGSTYSGTAGTWVGADYDSATGAVSVVGTSGATFYITGVQLEKGTAATAFEYRPYGTELALCQRYYYKLSCGVNAAFGMCMNLSTTSGYIYVGFLASMRIAPTALEQTGIATDYGVLVVLNGITCSSVPTFVETSTNGAKVGYTTAGSLVAGYAAIVYSRSASAYLAWSAEL